jgi:predicted phosphoribosyltransferase
MFKNRNEAGRILAEKLLKYRNRKDAIVLALPRGGVVIGYEIANKLKLPLDIVSIRKIGHPHNPEYAIGAVGSDGNFIYNEEEIGLINPDWLKQETKRQQEEAIRRIAVYREGRKAIDIKGKVAIIVDDGIATGLTVRAAVKSARLQNPKEIVVAAPVAPYDTSEILRQEADKVVVLMEDEKFAGAVGAYYDEFPQVSDQEVIELLRIAL